MPIKIPVGLPATQALIRENIFVMDEQRAIHQDIRPMKIAIINLMPSKTETEIQLLRLLSNTPLQVQVDLVYTSSHTPKNTSGEYLAAFYKKFAEIEDNKYDGMIITGAPVENLPFEEVNYWQELCRVMSWSTHNVYSTMYICWAAQAGLYYHCGIDKYRLPEKLIGIFPHYSPMPNHSLMRGFDDIFYSPHSRYTSVRLDDITANKGLLLLSVSDTAGVHIVADSACRKVFITGHFEYDGMTLANEYARDQKRGVKTPLPYGYFPQDDPDKAPIVNWRAHANLLFSNWLNYIVYQRTPYDLSLLK